MVALQAIELDLSGHNLLPQIFYHFFSSFLKIFARREDFQFAQIAAIHERSTALE